MRTRPLALGFLVVAMAGTTPVARGDEAPEATVPRRTLRYVGRVVDPQGTPVAGATVHAITGPAPQVMVHDALLPWRTLPTAPPVEPVGGSSLTTAPAPTGADGTFAIEGLEPPAGGSVVVVHPAYRPAHVPADPKALVGDTLTVGDVPLARGGSVRATVLDRDSAPVAGAWVVVQPRNMAWERFSPGEIRSARTGSDGVAVVEGLRDTEYAVGAFTDAVPPVEHEFVAATGVVTEATLRLVPGAPLRVTALDRVSGAPLALARVDLEHPIKAGVAVQMGAPPLATALTDSTGVAVFPALEVRDYVVTVVPPEHRDDHVHNPGAFSVRVVTQPGKDVEVRLDPPVACALTVVDAVTEAPVAGLTYRAVAEWMEYDRTGGSPVDVAGTVEGASDPVVVAGLRAGPWRFILFAPGYHPHRTDVVRVAPDAPPTRIALRPAAASATGRVVARRDGSPVAGAQLSSYEWVSAIGGGQRATATSDAAGRFRLTPLLGEGTPLRVEVKAPGYVPLVREAAEDARQEDLGDIALVRAATVRGVLVDAVGHPRTDIEVRLQPIEPRVREKGGWTTATTDAQGRFAFTEVAPGRYELRAGDVALPRLEVAEGADVPVRLEPPAGAGR